MTYKKCLCFLLIHIIHSKILATISIVDKGVLPLIKDSVAIQLFVDIENKDRIETCQIYTKVKKCCLTDSDEDDCEMAVYSETFNVVKPKDRNILIHVIPTLYQHDLIGYCEIVLIYHCPKKREKLKIQISFDTTMQGWKRSLTPIKDYIGNNKRVSCETLDQDSLDECLPTDCDLKYFDQRPFYDVNINRCTKPPVCLGDIDKELPDMVYVPQINKCKDLSLPLSFQDIYTISTGLGTVTTTDKPDAVKVRLKSNCTTISQNLSFLKDLIYGKLCPCSDNEEINYEVDCKFAVLSILFYIISVCALLFLFICCVNTIMWVHIQWLNGNIKDLLQRVESKFKWTKKKPQNSNRQKVQHSLLREVIVNDIPLELRDSIINLCDRVEKEVHKKKRYRKSDIGSQISLQNDRTVSSSTSSTSDEEYSDRKPLVK